MTYCRVPLMAKPRSGQPRVHQRRCSRPRRQKGTWGGHVQLIATGAAVWVRRRFRLVNKGMNVTLRICYMAAGRGSTTCHLYLLSRVSRCHCGPLTVVLSVKTSNTKPACATTSLQSTRQSPRTRASPSGLTSKKETGHTGDLALAACALWGNGARQVYSNYTVLQLV